MVTEMAALAALAELAAPCDWPWRAPFGQTGGRTIAPMIWRAPGRWPYSRTPAE